MNIQLIDEFIRRTNASYDEAKYYLEMHNGDLLEAIIAFEKKRMGYHGQRRASPKSGGFGRGLMRILQRLFDIKLVVTNTNQKNFYIPIIIPLVLFPVWHIMVLMAIVMLILGFKFGFQDMPDPNIDVQSFTDKIINRVRNNGKSCRG